MSGVGKRKHTPSGHGKARRTKGQSGQSSASSRSISDFFKVAPPIGVHPPVDPPGEENGETASINYQTARRNPVHFGATQSIDEGKGKSREEDSSYPPRVDLGSLGQGLFSQAAAPYLEAEFDKDEAEADPPGDANEADESAPEERCRTLGTDPAPKKAMSKKRAAEELVTPEVARTALDRLREGYTDKSGSGYSAATVTPSGCVLAQKGEGRKGGYVSIAPVSSRTRGAAGSHTDKPVSIGAHRLAIIAKADPVQTQRLLDGAQASHLCHQPPCFNGDHLVAESKKENEGRKECAEKLKVGFLVSLTGPRVPLGPILQANRQSLTDPPYSCPHTPKCIPREEEFLSPYALQ